MLEVESGSLPQARGLAESNLHLFEPVQLLLSERSIEPPGGPLFRSDT